MSKLLSRDGFLNAGSFGDFEYHFWVHYSLLPQKQEVPTELPPLLDGTIAVDPAERWTAAECVSWLDAHPNLASCLPPDTESQSSPEPESDDATEVASGYETHVVDLSEARQINRAAEMAVARNPETETQGPESGNRPSIKRTFALASLASKQGTSVAPLSKKKGKHLGAI